MSVVDAKGKYDALDVSKIESPSELADVMSKALESVSDNFKATVEKFKSVIERVLKQLAYVKITIQEDVEKKYTALHEEILEMERRGDVDGLDGRMILVKVSKKHVFPEFCNDVMTWLFVQCIVVVTPEADMATPAAAVPSL